MSNQVVLEINPRPGNARNSEGAFATLKDGRVIFAYTRFKASGGDNGAAEICARYSNDGGRTWTADDRLLVAQEGKVNVMSVSLLRLQDERLALLLLRKDDAYNCLPNLRFSSDEAETFSAPHDLTATPGYYVVNNDRMIQLASGRLVVPVSEHRVHHRYNEKDPAHPRLTHRGPGLVFYLLSDDAGQTWFESESEYLVSRADGDGMQEPGVLALRDGRLWSWARPSCRSPKTCQWELFSRDQGRRWSAPRRSAFRSPCSPMSVKRLPGSGDLLAVWNDHSGRFPVAGKPQSWSRTPLVCAISRDDGRTWAHHRALERSPTHGFCYIAIHPVDDAVLLGYCAGGAEVGGVLNRLRLRRLTLKELYK